ncbi:hypothetical protein Leryth_023850 [Lithospermum erythrorhizon]|uniref:Uncharacterized protein n=1 Tax=Lithospermum erythrorhizon TaxID=34254 RepID=A0AAV3Q1W0_LITER|nr:hypothetical protein Leryth_023850 [Lithospermum erythrorhizon]
MTFMENPWGRKKNMGSTKRLGDPSPKLTKKMSEKFGKTKEVASSGMKKMKEGTSNGVSWIKVKMNKNKLFQKK